MGTYREGVMFSLIIHFIFSIFENRKNRQEKNGRFSNESRCDMLFERSEADIQDFEKEIYKLEKAAAWISAVFFAIALVTSFTLAIMRYCVTWCKLRLQPKKTAQVVNEEEESLMFASVSDDGPSSTLALNPRPNNI